MGTIIVHHLHVTINIYSEFFNWQVEQDDDNALATFLTSIYLNILMSQEH